MADFGISSWSLHGLLGQVWYEEEGGGQVLQRGVPAGALPLLALPAECARHGINRLEICHFHFPRLDAVYLAELHSAAVSAGVQIDNLLLDSGNLSSLDDDSWHIDLAQAKRWLQIAAAVGAKGVRMDCGVEPAGPETIARAAAALRELADEAAVLGLRISTENFRQTSLEAADLLQILAQADRDIGLCVDYGNAAKTADKYGTLTQLLPHGTSVHAKPDVHDDQIDSADLQCCLELTRAAGFSGPLILIVGETDNEWERALALRAEIAVSF